MQTQPQIYEGATVYGADGEKVGKVHEAGANYIVVAKGFFFPTDYYIPFNAIASSTADGVYLTVSKDEALNQGWDVYPETYATDTAANAAWTGQTTTRGTDATRELADDASVRVPVHEERLETQKRATDAGEVTLNKRVVTETQSVDVPVTEERVRVDWRAPTGETTADGEVFKEGTIEVPVSREVVDVSKRTVQTGQVEVSKEREQRTEQVKDQVRREVVDVDQSGDVQVEQSGNG